MRSYDFVTDCILRIQELQDKGLSRSIAPISPKKNCVVSLDGSEVVSFCSNDYLGISDRSDLSDVAATTMGSGNFGSTGSRLLSGERLAHERLEKELASWLGYESGLLFPSGYQANLGVLPSILTKDDCVIIDREVHASIIDGCRLSKAKLMVYRHLDIGAARKCVDRASDRFSRVLLATESLFSMSGQYAPLVELEDMVRKRDGILYVDEAHAIGVCGKSGRGRCHDLGVKPDLLVGTCGKSIGTIGAFVMSRSPVREFIVNTCRSLIFTTSVPTILSEATRASIRIISSEVGDNLRNELFRNIGLFSLTLGGADRTCDSPIIPIIIGDASKAVALSRSLLNKGFFVPAIRPPTVAEGSSRLRISICANHLESQLVGLAKLLRKEGYSKSASAESWR